MHQVVAGMLDVRLVPSSSGVPFEIGRWLLLAAGALFLAYVAVLAVLVALSEIRHGNPKAERAPRD